MISSILNFGSKSLRIWSAVLVLVLIPGCGEDLGGAAGAGDESPNTQPFEQSFVDEQSNPSEVTEENEETEEEVTQEVAAELRVDGVSPAKGKASGGDTVTILGAGFGFDAKVMFDESEALNIFVLGDDRINVTTPPHAPGLARVTVFQADGEEVAVLEEGYLYYNDVVVSEIVPAEGPATGGTPVTVKGTGFTEGTKLLFGEQLAINTEFVDDSTILALTPTGMPGEVDVFVSNSLGLARLKDGFLYTAPPMVTKVSPVAGPSAGGQLTVIEGAGFVEPLEVRFGNVTAPVAELVHTGILHVTSPPHEAGAVDLWIVTPHGSTVVDDGYVFYDELPSGVEILNLVPHSGSVLGGTKVVVTATELGTSLDTKVRFNGALGEVLSVDPVTQSAVVVTPASVDAGWVDVEIQSPEGSAVSEGAFNYVDDLAIAEIKPNYGSADGGTEITVIGTGFQPDAEIFIDALPATGVEFVSENELRAMTPPGSPGFAHVKVAQGVQYTLLLNGFFYTSGGMDLYVITPDKGSIAGGTFVDVLGIGFAEDAEVYVGGKLASHTTFIDPTRLTARLPAGDVGTVDVQVVSLAGTALLENSYTYYDPVSLYGGTWGEAVDDAVNVTVLEGGSGAPVPDVFTILGSDPKTPFQGFTNLNGQITFSGPDLSGPQTVSVSKEGYENNSVVAFDAENVTIYMTKVIPSPGFPPGIQPPIVKGDVYGFGKYVVGEPGYCYSSGASDTNHCKLCDGDDECGAAGAKCTDLGSQGSKCLMTCETDSQCPSKSACKSLGPTSHCVPTPGSKVVVCRGTIPSIFSQKLSPGTGAVVNSMGSYSIMAYPGEIAVVCVGGFMDGMTEPLDPALVLERIDNRYVGFSYFTPVVMGVYRHLNLIPGQVAEDIDINLNIPLTRTLKLRLEDPPLDDTDYLFATLWFDFGSDGVFQAPVNPGSFSDVPLLAEGQPLEFIGDIYDASYTILAGAFTMSEDGTPMSVVLRKNLVEPEDDRMLRLVDGEWELASTGLTRNVLAAYGYDDDHVFTVGTEGSLYFYNGNTYSMQPSGTQRTLRAIHGTGSSDIWAVGDDGVVLHFNGIGWTQESSGQSNDLRAVFSVGGGEVFVAGAYSLRRRDPSGTWANASTTSVSGSWRGLHGTGSDDVWLVGDYGRVYHYDGAAWVKQTVPTVKNLRAVWAVAKDDVWVAGEGGTLLHYDGVSFSAVDGVPATQTVTAINGRSANEIYAVGNRGFVLVYDGNTWTEANTPDYEQNINGVYLPKDSSSVYTFGDHELFMGPMVPVPKFEVPVEGGVLTENLLSWEADTSVQPHFQYMKLVVPSMMGDTPVWTLMSDGEVRDVPLPDFPQLEGTPGIPAGPLKLTQFRVYKEGFDIDHFDYSDLSTPDWQAWALDNIFFSKVAP